MQEFITDEILKHAKVKSVHVKELIKVLFECNYELPSVVACERPSYLNFRKTIQWGGNVENAHIASLSALNSKHGCFNDCYKFIETYINSYESQEACTSFFNILIKTGVPLPGFGNPIYKEVDARCNRIETAFNALMPPEIVNKVTLLLNGIRESFSNCDITTVHPNLVFWNSVIAHSLGLPIHNASLIFILATQIRYINSLQETQPQE